MSEHAFPVGGLSCHLAGFRAPGLAVGGGAGDLSMYLDHDQRVKFLDEGFQTMILCAFERDRDAVSQFVHMKSCFCERFLVDGGSLPLRSIGQSTVRADVVAILSRALARRTRCAPPTCLVATW